MLVYNRALQSFVKFRMTFALQNIWPPPLTDIICYIVHLFKSGSSHSTIKCYISGLTFFIKINNWPDVTQNFVVKKLLEGSRRVKGSQEDSRLPITKPLLVKILNVLPQVCTSIFETKLFSASFLLAFYGFLRVGEVSCKSGGPDHTIKFHDFKILQESIEFHIASSKNDQAGKGFTISIAKQPSNICPVKAMREYLMVRPPVQGPLFCHFNGKALSSYQFSSVLKKALGHLKANHERILPHSFRIGRATSCAMDGMLDEEIKLLGRWKSNAYQKYVRIPK